MDIPGYNKQFLAKVKSEEPIYNNATSYGVQVKSISDISVPLNAKQYWRAIGVQRCSPRNRAPMVHRGG